MRLALVRFGSSSTRLVLLHLGPLYLIYSRRKSRHTMLRAVNEFESTWRAPTGFAAGLLRGLKYLRDDILPALQKKLSAGSSHYFCS
jgi:hypothetical protein